MNLGKHRRSIILLILLLIFTYGGIFIMGDKCILMAQDSLEPFKVMPWRVGQYAIYQITSFEGEDSDNRYIISITGKEEMNGKTYFWVNVDLYESIIQGGYNTLMQLTRKNLTFKMLVPPKDTVSFINNPEAFISKGLFPKDAVKLGVQTTDEQWYWIDPVDFFSHQDIIETTPYSLTPHAKGKINFNKLKIDKEPEIINSPAGKFSCYHLYVNTGIKNKYWDEGFDLWRSVDVPILGLVKMQFSNTRYWEKWIFQDRSGTKNKPRGFFSSLYKKRVPGRRNPDICTISLIDYGQR